MAACIAVTHIVVYMLNLGLNKNAIPLMTGDCIIFSVATYWISPQGQGEALHGAEGQ